tara:strand:+ start:332 stop:715 length:384 start_codon:yes stop_codon:yes gene_type:complete
MSIKLNENQLIAAHLLASGYKSCEVAKQLKIRQETLSRWRQNAQFDKAVNDTTEIILNEIINTHKNILILSQNVILEVLKDGNLDLIKKANIALRFISFMRGRDDLSDKSNKRLSDYKFEKSFPIID